MGHIGSSDAQKLIRSTTRSSGEAVATARTLGTVESRAGGKSRTLQKSQARTQQFQGAISLDSVDEWAFFVA